MLKIRPQKSIKELFLLVVFYLFLFQSPLAELFPLFAYVDELFPLLGIGLFLFYSIRTGTLRIKKSSAWICALLTTFCVVGLLGNFIYQYQTLSSVLIDLYTNLKFFLSILFGYVLFSICDSERERETFLSHARMMTVILFVLLVLDLLFHIFPEYEIRYGLRAEKLFYFHPTYLAGAVVFLLSVLMMFYEKKNRVFILLALIVLFFTLRGKAIAGVAIYAIICYLLLYRRKKLKLRYWVLMAVAVAVIGRDLFLFYYIDLQGQSARSVLTQTSFEIMKDYFPIGTGFGTFASAEAAENYSPVYVNYGFRFVYELDGNGRDFFSDTFWPIIFGQTGVIGTVCFLAVLMVLFSRLLKLKKWDVRAYAAGVFIFVYILISSTSEPAFNNSVAIPLAMLIGYAFTLEKQHDEKTERHRDRDLSLQRTV